MNTKKLYDIDAYAVEFEAKVQECRAVERANTCPNKEPLYEVILDQTLFFPEEGGQTPDKGTLNGIEVGDVQIKDNVITHVMAEPLAEGTLVKGVIDWQHRFFNMQQHSGEHLFSGLAYRKYGYHNVGFHLSNQIVTMDFDGVLTKEQICELEWEVNEAIVANVEITTGYPSNDVLDKLDYRSKSEIEGAVRIVEIAGYDVCACCAPHVRRTGEIGIFKIQTVQNYKGGARISFLCGFRALEEYRKKSQIISDLSGILTTNQDNLAEHVTKLKAQMQSVKGQLQSAKQTIMENKIADIPAEQEHVLLFETDLDTVVMRNVVNRLVEKHDGLCGVFARNDKDGYNYIIGSKNKDCREIATKLKEELNARGGGSAQMVQGSVVAEAEDIQQIITNG